MNKIKYYMPGVLMIFLAILIIAIPEILVVFIAGLVIMAGVGALMIGHRIKMEEQTTGTSGYDYENEGSFSRPIRVFYRRYFY